MNLPAKRKVPNYYQRVAEPIDLQTVEQNINTGVYKTVEAFDRDMSKLFTNNVHYHGRTSELGIAATRLRRIYGLAKVDAVVQLEEIMGGVPSNFIPEKADPGGRRFWFCRNRHLRYFHTGYFYCRWRRGRRD